jgi:hypothetical protein
MLTKTQEIDQITITGNGIVLYREAIIVAEDDAVLSKTYHRSSLEPGQDLSSVPEKVASVCRLVWTDDVVRAFQQSVAATARLDEVNT